MEGVRALNVIDVMPQGSCWEWPGKRTADGYGRAGARYAHRASFEAFIGPIPEDVQIDHLCRNRGCVNPLHLELVSRVENVMRGLSPHALNARRLFCVNGHEFTPENTKVQLRYGKKRRQCKECLHIRSKRYVQRQREATNVG